MGPDGSAVGSMNGAEFIGKQLAGKKAQYAGDPAMQDQTRKFGLVRSRRLRRRLLQRDAGEVRRQDRARRDDHLSGDHVDARRPGLAQEQAPVAIAKLKAAGVTTVVLLADSAMVRADEAGDRPGLPPRVDLLRHRRTSTSRCSHGGTTTRSSGRTRSGSRTSPRGPRPPRPRSQRRSSGTSGRQGHVRYLLHQRDRMAGVRDHVRRPEATPQTLKQGFFSIPALGGSASTDPARQPEPPVGLRPHQRTPLRGIHARNKDFTASWWDPDTDGPPILGFPGGKGTLWYLDDAKRYYAGHWPTKPLDVLRQVQAIYQFDAPAAPRRSSRVRAARTTTTQPSP